MAEAVFSISADITPQINERELERQAQLIARQINGILAKQIEKVSFQPASGSFRPFQQEIAKSLSVLDRFQGVLSGIPRTIGNISRTGKSAFLKFTDAINVTRREFVGFSNGIRESIRNTNLFETALDGIRATGSTISELPQSFEVFAAQVRSGTSALDQAAQRGSQLAQIFQPIQLQGEATRTELVELNSSIDQLTQIISRFASASGKAIDATKNDFDLLGTQINNLEKPFFRVQAILNDAGLSASLFGKRLRATFEGAAGDPEKLVEALVALRDQAQKTAGPMGFLAQILGKVTEEERAAAKAARLELNASLIELGRGDQVAGLQKITAQFALLRQRIGDFVGFFTPAVQKIKQELVGLGLVMQSTEFGQKLVDSFRSVGSFFETNLVAPLRQGLQIIRTETAALGPEIVGRLTGAFSTLSSVIGRNLTQIGGFLKTNLTTPLREGLKTLGAEFARLGQDITSGLGKGISAGASGLTKSLTTIRNTVVNGLRTLFKISSPSKVTEPMGYDVSAGFAAGITRGSSLVTKALNSLTHGLTALGASAAQFAKSAVTVASTALATLGGVALTTGLSFNTLQQVISATLPVLVGSKQASDELLKSINELNDTSPFARSSFLELTRVLAGFGVQAKEIPGLIDAIQQTVAATGGGEQDLLELGQAFARIQSQGRLSLDVLQSFSSRGVDAIGILATQLGKTQGEIREMISGGLIPADVAIDNLAAGLKEKFDGATEAVSKNLPGALDRIRAKLRDAGAELIKAFVNPEGGGALVTFLNQIASSLTHITKNILPLLRPVLEGVATVLTTIGEKVQTFVTALQSGAVKDFAGQFGSLLPVLAAVVGFLPQLFSFIPVIGPLIAGLGGPFVALAAAMGVIAARSEEVRNSLKPLLDAFSSVGAVIQPLALQIFPKLEALFGQIVQAAAPFVAFIIEKLAEILPFVGQAFVKLMEGLQPIIAALQRLFEALKPTFEFLKNVVILLFQGLGPAFKIVGETIALVIDAITFLVSTMDKGLAVVNKFLAKLIESKVVQGIFETIATAVERAIDALDDFADVLDFALGPLLDIPEIAVDFKINTKDSETNVKALKTVATESAAAIQDAFDAATFAQNQSAAALSNSFDTVRQNLQTVDQSISPIIDAAKAAQTAATAVGEARNRVTEANAEIVIIEQERAKALQDVIAPIQEVTAAERDLARVRRGLVSLDREELDIQKELINLRGQDTVDKRAALDRDIERAKIALNRARQSELDLINEGNAATATSIDISGLSLDQIKGRLRTVKATLAAQKQVNKQNKQEKEDERKSASLDVSDAEQTLKDAEKSRLEFEETTSEAIRDNEERLLELREDKADRLIEEQAALKEIEKLRAGETSQQRLILDFDDKIKEAKEKAAGASKALQTAIEGSQLAAAQLALKSAEIRKDVEGQASAQAEIWRLKQEGLGFDAQTEAAIRTQVGLVGEAVAQYRILKDENALAIQDMTRAGLIQEFSRQLLAGEGTTGFFDQKIINVEGRQDTATALKAVLSGGAALVKGTQTAALLTPERIDAIIAQILKDPGSDLREIFKRILEANGLSIPNFAAGYAPGELIHRGMNDGVGLVRMFEYGKEAVLPLTRKFDLSRVVNNPAVLPKILEALPRWSMPSQEEISDGIMPTLIPRSVPSIRGSGSAAIDRRKEQKELAGAIGSAVKSAVMEALSEGGMGADVDINVTPSSGNEILIAREVARQIKKVMNEGRW